MADKPVIDPNPETLPEILASLPDDTPIVMLNLLGFNETARYKDGVADYSGREAYQKYYDVAFGKVRGVGGELVWKGKALAGVIAPEGEKWDDVLLVRYPSNLRLHAGRPGISRGHQTSHRSIAGSAVGGYGGKLKTN